MSRLALCVIAASALISIGATIAAEPKPAASKTTKPAPVAAKPKPQPPEADGASAPPTECRWATGPITIDGKADEPAWAEAVVIDDFRTPWLPGAPKALTACKARLLWDGQYLYFHADMDDGDLFADVTEHDGWTWENDVFELFFRPDPAKPSYYEFQVNAAGTMTELFIPEQSPTLFDDFAKRDVFTWKTAVVRRGTLNERDDEDAGWSCEGRIPWVDMIHTGARPTAGETWHFALCRYDYDGQWPKPNLSTTARFTRMQFHQLDGYTPLTFVGPKDVAPRPYGLNERVPLTTSTVVGSPDPPPPYRVTPAFPKLALHHLIMVRHQPDSRFLWAAIQPKNGAAPAEIVRFVDDPDVSEYETLLPIEGTAYDLTFHPRFAENGYVYVGWNGPPGDAFAKKTACISRFTVDVKSAEQKIVPDSEVRIIEWASNGHDGLSPAFGNDGMLYVTTGDGSSDSDEWLSGQDMTRLLAKLLRIDVDNVSAEDAAAGRHYSVPKDNPFVGVKDARPETWAYGFRNPWRMAVDRETGHVWVTQNGQDQYEQVYFVRKGENYGWSVMEGGHPFYLERERGPTPIIPPTVEHSHAVARSLTGGSVYYGSRFPELRGTYSYADYSTGKIWIVRHDGERVVESREIADTTLSITAIAPDSRGELLVCDYQGQAGAALFRLEPTPPAPPSTFPRRLSDSGLFEPGKGHMVAAGVIPYTVNSPLWSDGTHKERFIAVPGDGKVNPAGRRSWEFPEGSVLIKSFALEAEAGNAASRRWIETRFLTKQQNEWIGYTYAWNDEQTDAELVEAPGLDRTYVVRDAAVADGERTQKWHYPSRAECMVCHSRAANFVLGVSTAQLNCDLDYGGTTDNQLRTLSHSGLFAKPLEADWRELTIRALREAGMNTQVADGYWKRVDVEKRSRRKLAPRPTAEADAAMFEWLVDPADESAPLELRARSYLHANCAHCHTGAGGGNAQIQLAYWNSLFETKSYKSRPLHSSLGVRDARIIAPGEPEKSMMLHRLATQERGRMPPVAVSLPDPVGIDVVRRWIASLPTKRMPTQVAAD